MEPEAIKALRESLDLSQEGMARRVGTTAVSISRWERGVAKPRGLYAKALADLAKRTR